MRICRSILFFNLCFIISFSAVDVSASEVSVEKRTNDGYLFEVFLTSRHDDLNVYSYSINRGCSSLTTPRAPFSLKFGATISLGLFACDPIEVGLETSEGQLSLSWDEYVSGGVSIQKQEPDPGYVKLIVRSRVDEVQILDVKVNRGNCEARPIMIERQGSKIEDPLSFGQRVAYILNYCDPIEVDVLTTVGMGRFTFD